MKKRRGRARNGEGTIYQRQDGGYTIQLTLPSGKRKSYSARTPEEAQQLLEEERHKLYQGLPVPGERWKVDEFLDTWLENIKASIRPSTWERYQDYVRLHIVPEVGRMPLVQLSPAHRNGSR